MTGAMRKAPFLGKGAVKSTGLALTYLMLRYRAASLKLTAAWGDALREVLPDSSFEVHVAGPVLRISGLPNGPDAGVGYVSTPALRLLGKGRMSEKLRSLFEEEATAVQDIVARAMGAGWQASDLAAHVEITGDVVRVSWRSPASSKTIALRPLYRSKLGV